MISPPSFNFYQTLLEDVQSLEVDPEMPEGWYQDTLDLLIKHSNSLDTE